MATFDPSVLGIVIFCLIAGICPAQRPVSRTDWVPDQRETKLSPANILKLTLSLVFRHDAHTPATWGHCQLYRQILFFLNSTIAWAIGGALMILMRLQLLLDYKPPIRKIFNFFRVPVSCTITGTFLLGLSFGEITVGRGAPILLIVLTYIAFYHTQFHGFFNDADLCCRPLHPSYYHQSVGGAPGKKIKETGTGKR